MFCYVTNFKNGFSSLSAHINAFKRFWRSGWRQQARETSVSQLDVCLSAYFTPDDLLFYGSWELRRTCLRPVFGMDVGVTKGSSWRLNRSQTAAPLKHVFLSNRGERILEEVTRRRLITLEALNEPSESPGMGLRAWARISAPGERRRSWPGATALEQLKRSRGACAGNVLFPESFQTLRVLPNASTLHMQYVVNYKFECVLIFFFFFFCIGFASGTKGWPCWDFLLFSFPLFWGFHLLGTGNPLLATADVTS